MNTIAPSSVPAPGHRALRRHRVSQSGRAYLITASVRGRAPVFSDFPTGCAVARLMQRRDLWRASKPLCWVLMPDHWHALVELGEGDDLGGLLARVKSAMARTANRALGRTGPLWQTAFHERALRKDENLRDAARYLVANPLRAGLVERIGDYPFWDAAWLEPGGAVL